MKLRKKTVRPALAILVTGIALLLAFQGLSVNAGTTPGNEIKPGQPHAVTGTVHWPSGAVEDTAPIPVTITNNRTGEFGVVVVDVLPGGNPNGTYQVDLSNGAFYPSGYLTTDVIYVNCTYNNMWAHNETVVGGLPFSMCDLHLIWLLAMEDINAASGGTMTSVDGSFSLQVPPGALGQDTILYAVNSTNPKPNAFGSIDLLPNGLTFSSPATLDWSYASIPLGSINEHSLKIFTFDGAWQLLPGTVDAVAKAVSAQLEHFSPFSMGSANATAAQVPIPFVYPAQLKVPILNITLTNTDPTVDDTLQYINVSYNGTDGNDVTNLHIWNDANSNYILDATDPQIGPSLPLTGGSANFTALAENVPANSSVRLFAALDVSPTAVVGNLIDLYVPIFGIGMANAGVSLEALDPTGNTTIKQENLTDPHAVYGYVTNIGGPIPNAWVNLTNNRTGMTEDLMADNLGRYDVNLGLMPGGYLDGDPIYVQANDTFGQVGWNTTTVNASNFGEQCDIFLGAGPIASDETPALASVITDIYRNITVNITSPVGLNFTTIILEVEGINYTLANANLTFSGDTLTFNTTGAVGSWSNGQTVNVTLWQVNDTVGNPGLNVPYVWWFNVSAFPVGQPANLTLSNSSFVVRLDWDTVLYADGYNVYRSNDKFAAWPWTKVADNVTATNWTDGAGTYSDPNTYYYIVRAWNPVGEGGNSSLGTKIRKTFTYIDETLNTNKNWISLPYNSNYNTISDIIVDIEGGTIGPNHAKFISAVYIWNNATQGVNGMTGNNFLGWAGSNLPINPGDAIRFDLSNVMNPGESFNWTVVGTDVSSTQNFTYIDATLNTNINWISVPYGSNYSTLSDIITQIEGGLVGPGHAKFISAVYIWNAATQGVNGMTGNNFLGWAGSDLTVNPGDAIRFDLSNVMNPGDSFSWNPWVMTPPVPDVHYYD
jgi:hypothetical protein